ncbi:sortase A [Blastococcus aurantiacus]|uniref:Sortase A n=1 Tax=Blastococcus aurantiacus TaxID=1550231 RepID=A0A1G7MY23_9ACTN|nr:class E sortase [Blastococcus aurantiacus]SDF66566.1 sortase A [Blastococcus aurantiacus]
MADPDVDELGDRTLRWERVPDLPPLARGDRDEEQAVVPPGRGFWRTVALGAGELLVTAGVVLLLFVVYEVYVTDLLTAQRQDELSEELREEWESAPAPSPGEGRGSITRVELGDAFAVLRIPRLGEDYTRVVLEGTEEKQLSQGPGHYVDSAMPGEDGNLALAGHRVGKGSPFLELDAMQPGDPIVVETADSWFVYRVLGDKATGDVDADPSGIPGMHVVSPSAVEVVAPTPNAAGAAPSGAYLTLTTCHPRYSARQRLIVHARLDGGALSKAEYPDGPDALYENR